MIDRNKRHILIPLTFCKLVIILMKSCPYNQIKTSDCG